MIVALSLLPLLVIVISASPTATPVIVNVVVALVFLVALTVAIASALDTAVVSPTPFSIAIVNTCVAPTLTVAIFGSTETVVSGVGTE